MSLNSSLLAHGCPLSRPCHIRPGFHHVLQSNRARSQARANIPSGGGGDYNYPSRLGQALDDISPVTPCSNSAAPVPGPRRTAAGSQRRQGPSAVAAPGASPASRALPAPRSCHPPSPCSRGHLHGSPGPPGYCPGARGARGVTITTGRPPRRPLGRK